MDSPRGIRAMPYEIANAIYLLATDDNMIGTILQTDGGRSLYWCRYPPERSKEWPPFFLIYSISHFMMDPEYELHYSLRGAHLIAYGVIIPKESQRKKRSLFWKSDVSFVENVHLFAQKKFTFLE